MFCVKDICVSGLLCAAGVLLWVVGWLVDFCVLSSDVLLCGCFFIL